MTLLSLCTNACNNVGLNTPQTIFNNNDPAALRLLQLARRAGRSLATKTNWTALVTEHVFIANGQSDYSLPSDFRSLVDGTLWDRTRYWQMRGAMSPQQWQMYKSSSLGQASVERRWRIRLPSGATAGAATVFSIDPAVGSTDTSSQFVFEYVSKNYCQSATTFALEEATISATGLGYVIGDLLTLSGGTSTAAATIRVTGVTAGAITAAQVEAPGNYTALPSSPASVTGGGAGTGAKFTISATTFPGRSLSEWSADTDTGILDEDLLEMGLIWRLQERVGLSYLEAKEEYERELDIAVAQDGGAAVLDLASQGGFPLISPWNIPETGFGT